MNAVAAKIVVNKKALILWSVFVLAAAWWFADLARTTGFINESKSPPGFDRVEWRRCRPSRYCKVVQEYLKNAGKQKVLTLLGEPNSSAPAGEGMFGPYKEYFEYDLDYDFHVEHKDHCYVWESLDVEFLPNGKVSEIRITSHCY